MTLPKTAHGISWPGALFILIAVLVGVDLAADLADRVGGTHIVLELVALAIALGGVAGTAAQLRRAHLAKADLERDLAGTRADLTRWRNEAQELLRGLGAAIDEQFADWGLSSAEREVAMLILKGLSYKDVAAVRETSERTVRHQALAIYRKAGVAGRAEMAAFFLEDLLLPPDQAPTRHPESDPVASGDKERAGG